MYNQLNRRCILISALVSVTFMSCRREAVNPPVDVLAKAHSLQQSKRALNVKGNSAAAHIAASEKLDIPAAVAVPDNGPNGHTRIATYYAVGVQKYKAREIAGSNPVAYEWVLVAPDAHLYDASNAKVGTHGAGPFWQLSPMDIIYGQHFSPARTAPGSDRESIDWLLLMPKTGTIPTGLFAGVAYIQRIATKGGKAPDAPPANATETVDVKYKAVYRFTKKIPEIDIRQKQNRSK